MIDLLTPYWGHITALLVVIVPTVFWYLGAAMQRRFEEMHAAAERFERHREQAQR